MKRIFLIASFVILACFGNKVMAQSNELLYHSFRAPQSNQVNPAMFPSQTMLYFTLPGVSFNFNSPLSISDMLTYTPGDSVTRININNITDKLKQNCTIGLGAEIDLLGLGFTFGDNFITIGSRIIANASINLPVDAINIITNGNLDDNGNPIDQVTLIDGELFNAQAYLENSIGFGHEFEDLGLTVGAKVKLLNGIMGITTNNTSVKLNTASDMSSMSADVYYNITAGSYMKLDTASFSFVTPTDIMDYLPSVNGVAFDLGATYKWKKFNFSASVLNLSKGLNWKDNNYEIAPEGGNTSFVFNGIDLVGSGMLNNGNFNLDTMINYFQSNLSGLKPQHKANESFYQSIPTKMNLGVSYDLQDWVRFGALFHGEWAHGWFGPAHSSSRGNFRFSTTLSASINFANWIELIAANSLFHDGNKMDVFNPGVGLILTPLSILQVYVMADYVSSIYAVEAKDIKARVGLNVLFGNRKFRKAKLVEEPIIIEETAAPAEATPATETENN